MPQATFERLIDRISKGKPIPALTLLGSDPYLRDRCRDAVIEKFVPAAARQWAVTKISVSAGGLDELLERARMMPMLSPVQVLLLEDAEALDREGESSEQVTEGLSAYLDDPAPFSILIFVAEALDRRRRLYKTLAEKSLFVELSVGREDVAALAADLARELGAEIAPAAVAELVDVTNGEPSKVRLELEKLSLYAAGRKIEVADVEALVVSAQKFTVWKLAEVLAARDRRAAMEFLDGLLREGEQPAQIVGALAWMYRKLVEARELPPNANPYQVARELGMRPETAAIALAQSRKIPKDALLSGIVALAEADSELKAGASNPRAIMEFLLARITATSAASVA
jgi:DNA polymerase-3 subunit delta